MPSFRKTAAVAAVAVVLTSYSATAFAPSPRCYSSPKRVFAGRPVLQRHQLFPIESSSILDAVEYFDGSEVVDPVVVSDVFWTSLQSKFLSFILGQLLAVGVFAIITSLASAQISKIGDWVSNNIFKGAPPGEGGQQLKVPPELTSTSNLTQPDFVKLLLCIAIDVIGTSSELVPILGEVTDLAWAPIAAIALRSLYGSNVILALEFTEEILPFTDILPLATICWVVDSFFPDSDLAKLLQLGRYSQVVNGSGAIDVEGKPEAPQTKLLMGDKDTDLRK